MQNFYSADTIKCSLFTKTKKMLAGISAGKRRLLLSLFYFAAFFKSNNCINTCLVIFGKLCCTSRLCHKYLVKIYSGSYNPVNNSTNVFDNFMNFHFCRFSPNYNTFSCHNFQKHNCESIFTI